MSVSPTPPHAEPPDVIDRDCPCITCAYNLRTVPLNGKCSECATPVLDSLRAHAMRLAGAHRRWLRNITNALLWLILAMLFPSLFIIGLPSTDYGEWLSRNRIRLLIVLIPAIFATTACWRIAAREHNPKTLEHDQPITRWTLRIFAMLWLIPPLFIAGPFYRREFEDLLYERYDTVRPLAYAGLLATILFFRRLKSIARRLPSKILLHQCNVIGSQLPIATLLLMVVLDQNLQRPPDVPDVLRYVIATPLPAVGVPWLLAFNAPELKWINWQNLLSNPESLLIAACVVVQIAPLLLAVEFLIALIRARRSDPNLPAYCQKLILSEMGNRTA